MARCGQGRAGVRSGGWTRGAGRADRPRRSLAWSDTMKKRTLLSGLTAATLLVALAAAGPGGVGQPSGHRATATGDADRGRGDRFEVKDPDKDAKPGMIAPAQQAYVDRAYPRGYTPASAVLKATRAARGLPVRLGRAKFRTGTPDIAAQAAVGADWEFIG